MRHFPRESLLWFALAAPVFANHGGVDVEWLVYAVFAGPFWLGAMAAFGHASRSKRGVMRLVSFVLFVFCSNGPTSQFLLMAAIPIVAPVLLSLAMRTGDDEPRAGGLSDVEQATARAHALLERDDVKRATNPTVRLTDVARGARCPVCSQAAGSPALGCARCHTPHHADCFEYNRGCGVYGCI